MNRMLIAAVVIFSVMLGAVAPGSAAEISPVAPHDSLGSKFVFGKDGEPILAPAE